MAEIKITEDQIDDIIEDIMTSTWESGKTKILNFARLMCDKQKNLCSAYADTIVYHQHDNVDRDSIINTPYPDEIK